MCALVSFQYTKLAKHLSAIITPMCLLGLVTSVTASVIVQVSGLAKRLVANVAPVRPLPGMNASVLNKVSQLEK